MITSQELHAFDLGMYSFTSYYVIIMMDGQLIGCLKSFLY